MQALTDLCCTHTGICLLTKRLSLRQRITATSTVFFHRFYSCSPGNSFSSTDPALVATACVYVASKVEETPVHIRNVVQEAAKFWADLGHWKFPTDVSSLAEMEFYLLEDLQFHMIVYHPYRSLIAIHTASGKGATKLDHKMSLSSTWASLLASSQPTHGSTGSGAGSTPSGSGSVPIGSGDLGGPSNFMDPELAYDSPGAGLSGRRADGVKAAENGEIEKIKQLDRQSQIRVMQEMIDERHRMFLYGGDDNMPLPRLEELDDQVLQMAWFVLNDTYRTDVLLQYPPHIIAVAAIFLAIVLHDPSRERMMRSKRWMDDRRERYRANLLHPKDSNLKVSSKSNGSNGTPTAKPDAAISTPPVSGASPPKPMQPVVASPSPAGASSPPAAGHPSRPALRGLASLPPRPAHLPMKPTALPPPPPPPAAAPQQSPQIGASPAQSGSPAGMFTVDSPARSGATATGDLSPAIAAAAEMNASNPPVPPPDAMTFLAALNVDLNSVGEIVQEMLSLYDIWHRVSSGNTSTGNSTGGTADAADDPKTSINIGDGQDMFRRLDRMRENRRQDLMRNTPGFNIFLPSKSVS